MPVWKLVDEIEAQLIPYGFTLGMHYLVSVSGSAVTCMAELGQYRRYFTLDTGTELPKLGLFAPGESGKPIEQVAGSVVQYIPLNDLVSEGLEGILRRFGFYPLLSECGSLRLSDFVPVRRSHAMPIGYFGAYRYSEVTLELIGRLIMGGAFTESASHQAAREWGGPEYIVVSDHEGKAVAVYRNGVQVL